MASQCKRQQCTIDRRGFRQELDSWRHKLIHCVGFESILDGLFGPELVQDLQLFKDSEPTTVSDWSFDENCLFCCLRRDKVKEHLIGLSHEGLDDTPKPLQVRDQTNISRLEKQAEEFLHAVLTRKDVPNFSDPHIPVVAREILQRMIKQFAAEYTSKTSSSQDSCSDSQPLSDQSLPTPPLISGAPPSTSPATTLAGPAHNQNPVLSKLLMADQDAPLDLTIKKPLATPSDQDGVLDLSIKKNRYSSILPVRSPCLSPAVTTIKGESTDVCVSKTKDLQSTSTLEQFMAKLCPHHQRQIVDAIGYLQTEVKALGSSSSQQDSIFTSGIKGTTCSTPKSHAVNPEKSFSELRFPSESTPKTEVQDTSYSILSSCEKKNVPDISLKTSAAGPALDLRSSGLGSNQTLATTNANQVDTENNRHGDHAPLRLKIMTSNVAAGKRLSCVLNASFSSLSDTLEEGEVNSNSSSRTETHSARLSSSMKRHSQSQVRQRELQHAKDSPTKLFSVHMTIPPDSPRTARKTIRASSDHRIRDSAYRGIVDPDLGHCDIVFIDKPITECFKERQSNMVPRRNARKSTRGHMFSDEIWELKTVRTLARRGNCPNPMTGLITLVTPKQLLSKPEGVPPVDMPFAGACRETMIQQMSSEQLDESVIPGTGDAVEVAASEVDIVVETSQTDQSQSKGQSVPPSPTRSPTESQETDLHTDAEEYIAADSGKTTGFQENCGQAPSEAGKDEEPEPREEIHDSTEQIVAETVLEPLQNNILEETESQLSSEELLNSEPILEQSSSTPKPANLEEETETETEESTMEKVQDERPQEMQPETQAHTDNAEVRETSVPTGSAEELMTEESEMKTSEAAALPSESEDGHEDGSDDLSSKTLDALLKELPPWRRKKGTVISPPKQLPPTETVVVGYVNGRPVSASDRSLRRKSSNSTILTKMSTKRPLRTSQTPAESQVSPPKSNISSISPSKSAATHSAPSTEHLPTLPLPPSLPVTAPQVISSLPAATEQSQPNAVQETTVELNTEKTQPVETTSEEILNDVETRLQAKQKPGSAKAAEDDSKNEAEQPSGEESSPLENQSPEKTEMQSQTGQQRGKRVHRTEVESLLLEPCVASLVDWSAMEDDSSSSVSEKPTRMPLRSERSKVGMSPQSVTQTPVDNKKSALRSQRLASPNAPTVTAAARQSEVASPVRIIPERMTKAQVKSPPASTSSGLPHSSANPLVTPRREPPKQTNRFFETLTGEENQHLITNLNHKYDKMQRGWVQMDKEGQPVIKYKNKADRQAAIWKSKRRAKKSKSLEHQKYSPVQMLFMKGFNLTSICRWFLDSTETKSLVIVKKVNTRLPSETQLCFHSSSSAGTSQGVFPSLQAERLKKHLKKFAIASPVKSNPKSQKLIAKALEQEGIAFKGKERRELLSATQTIIKSLSAEASAQKGETHKSSGKSKNPASARILRKYSNIREKMQVQQTNVRLNKASKTIKTSSLKRLANTKSTAKSILKPSLKAQKSPLPASKQTKEPAAKLQKSKTLADKKTTKQSVQNRVVKAQSSVKAPRETTKKELPKRSSLRLGSPKKPDQNPAETSKSKVDSKKEIKAEKVEVEKPAVNKMNAARIQPKESKSTVAEIRSTETAVETPQQSVVPASPDQVLTRSQRKMEAVVPASGSTSPALKRTTKSMKSQNASPKPDRKVDEPALTRSGALRAPTKRGRPASLPKSSVKAPTKRAQQLPETPAKRTRTSLAK
ncbi:uro-adherence factor A isoform X1 [Labrus bergylta]|uniref:uro-adherence factor A isoform X1 n=1 Tax=Labrus bergylta TaxID=56723 RepID=UPI0033141649